MSSASARLSPEPIEVVAERIDAGRVQLVDSPITLGTIDDQMRVLQDPQVLRNRGTADRKAARELAHRLRSLEQAFENRPPGRIAQRIQLLTMFVSNHLR